MLWRNMAIPAINMYRGFSMTSSGTLQRIFYRHLHILYNALSGACRILLRNDHKALHIYGTYLSPFHCQGSLTELLHSMLLRIPYPVECNLPSFLHPLPVCTKRRNDYR